jgi:hypothetical protein
MTDPTPATSQPITSKMRTTPTALTRDAQQGFRTRN